MSIKSYKKSINTKVSSERVFEVITLEMSSWWNKMSGVFKSVGDEATINFLDMGKKTTWRFQAEELIPSRRVTLKCIEANHIFSDQPKGSEEEWLGTKLIFSIESVETGTVVHFTHEGLNKKNHCYDLCEAGWDHFFGESLKSYLS